MAVFEPLSSTCREEVPRRGLFVSPLARLAHLSSLADRPNDARGRHSGLCVAS
jgi:hypothetical protein